MKKTFSRLDESDLLEKLYDLEEILKDRILDIKKTVEDMVNKSEPEAEVKFLVGKMIGFDTVLRYFDPEGTREWNRENFFEWPEDIETME
jgi:hypothetical protein